MGAEREMDGFGRDLLVLIPVFDDWASLSLLLGKLDRVLADAGRSADVLLIDDASTEPVGEQLSGPFSALERIELLRLRRNLGHQRAIAIGLAHCEEHLEVGSLVVMDGDGEDDPADVLRLADHCAASTEPRIVFAKRERRSEGLLFRLGYLLFKFVHRLLTGRRVCVGNFSCIPGLLLARLVVVSELWSHYAAAVMKARLPTDMIPTRRASRLAGKSTMNFTALVTHGLSAISVFADTVGVRLLIATSVLVGLLLSAMATVVFVRFGTDLAIPGWATTSFGLLLVVVMQLVATGVVLIFVTLGGKQATSFIPTRDYRWFCEDRARVFPRA